VKERGNIEYYIYFGKKKDGCYRVVIQASK
jgi:hypothetical protein